MCARKEFNTRLVCNPKTQPPAAVFGESHSLSPTAVEASHCKSYGSSEDTLAQLHRGKVGVGRVEEDVRGVELWGIWRSNQSACWVRGQMLKSCRPMPRWSRFNLGLLSVLFGRAEFYLFPNHEYFILEQTAQGVFAATSTHMLFKRLLFVSLVCRLLNDSSLISLPIASSWENYNCKVFSFASFFFTPWPFSYNIESSWQGKGYFFPQDPAQLYEGERWAATEATSYCIAQLCLSLTGHNTFSGSDDTQIR